MEEFDCEQSGGGSGDDGGENEEPVNFLVQFPIPCLICGVDLQVDGIVKKEGRDFGDSFFSGEDNGTVFNWFLKWFRVDIGKNGKHSSNGGDEGEGDILKFCDVCKSDLMGILVLQRQLDELEIKINDGLETVKRNMERCEEAFHINGVYDRDQRYKRVRSRIVKRGITSSSHHPQKNDKSSGNIRRKSTRNIETPVSRFNSTTNSETDDQLLPLPHYMLPPSHQAGVQEHCTILEAENPEAEADIKPDITFIHEPLPSPSPGPPTTSSKNVRQSSKTKAKSHQLAKSKKKLKTKSKAHPPKNPRTCTKTIKPSAPPAPPSPTPSSPDVNDQTDNYFLEDNFNEDSDDDDNPGSPAKQLHSRPQRKRRKIYVQVDEDEEDDFILDGHQDNSSSEDDNDQDFWSLRHPEGYHRSTYNLDPSTNTITVGSIPFTISSDQTKITCNLCPTAPPVKNDKDAMRRHITKYHTDRYTCPHCPFRGESNGPLRLHIQTVHEGLPKLTDKKHLKRFPCKICGKPIRHQRNHEWSHMSQQERDEVTFKEPQRLPDWLRNRIQCEDCGKDFSGKWQLNKHREREHEGVEKEKELCPECGGTFKNLAGHRKSQHGGEGGGRMEGRFVCLEEGCGKIFTKMTMLTRHKNAVHRKLRPWRCEVCGRGFSGEVTWREHMNGHLGVRPWKCEGEGCGAAFNRKSHLQRHMRIYHEEGSRPKRKVFLRGPTVLGEGFKKKELQREGTYYPPSALRGWAKGRVPGHLKGGVGGMEEAE